MRGPIRNFFVISIDDKALGIPKKSMTKIKTNSYTATPTLDQFTIAS